MHDLSAAIRSHGGLIATRELYARGETRRSLATLVEHHRLVRVRQGWYSTPGLAREAFQAARVGGVLTCAGALRAHGIWAPMPIELHVLVGRGSARLRTPRDHLQRLSNVGSAGIRTHWISHPTGAHRLVASIADALHTYRRCAPQELYLASLDSVLHRTPILRDALAEAGHPVDPGLIDGTCESGTETIFLLKMHRLLPRMRRQVTIAGIGRVDFLVGEALVIEVDGKEFHDREETFESDRRRDAELSRRGYRVLRFSYSQVMSHWELVEAAVMAAVSRGDHLRG